MKELFVAVTGNDNNDGSIDKPFKSLQKAKDTVKKFSDNDDIVVNIRGGRYFFEKSLEFNKEDSAKNGHTVTYRAFENEKVFFDGGVVIEPSLAEPINDETILNRIIDEKAREKVLQINLRCYNIKYGKYGTRGFRRAQNPAPNELFINTHPYTVARYPNEGEELIPLKKVIDSGSKPYEGEFDLRPAIFEYEDKRCDKWANAKGFYVSGLFFWCFADDTLEIGEIDTNKKTMTTVLPHLPGFKADKFTSWFAVNLLEEIDIPGEYYIDSESEMLYFYPKECIDNALIQISVLDSPIVVMEDASDITFDGIVFENSRCSGVYIDNGENCIIKNCVFRNLGTVAVQIGKGATALPEGRHTAHGIVDVGIDNPKSEGKIIGSWHEMLYQYAAWNNEGGKRHGIVNCEIYNIAAGGILLGGGDRKTLQKAENYVENCEIHNVNRLDRTYKAAVNISGVGNIIRNCDIYDLTGFAVYLHGNDHLIEYNKIHDVIKEVSDAGAIYMGRDLSEVGNVIRYNFIYDIYGLDKQSTGVCAIYFDDYSSFNAVYENYFYNISQNKNISPFGTVFWNCGGQTSVNNNIFIDCRTPMGPNDNGMHGISKMLHSDEFYKKRVFTVDLNDYSGVDVTSDIYKERYPYLYNLFNGTYNNEVMKWNNVCVYGEYTMFANAKNLDFTIVGDQLKDEAMMYINDFLMNVNSEREFFHIVDFRKIGRKK